MCTGHLLVAETLIKEHKVGEGDTIKVKMSLVFLPSGHMQANKANRICLSQTTKILDKNCFTKKNYCQIVKFDNHGHAQKQFNIC